MTRKQGKITPNGVSLQKHESDTIVFFTEHGFDIELIPESHIPGQHSADLIMTGMIWETKAPRKSNYSTIEHAFRNALRQSKNVIFDLRRIKCTDQRALVGLKKLFILSKRVKRLKVITKQGELLEFQK